MSTAPAFAPFRCAALVGKHHESISGSALHASRAALLDVHAFLQELGLHVLVEAECARALWLEAVGCDVARVGDLGRRADVGVAVGGDGTMLGLARQMAPFGMPLIGINQGRLGFVTDIALDQYRHLLPPMLLQGRYESDERALMHGRVLREGACVFEALAANDVVVHRGAAASMVELEAHADGRLLAGGGRPHPASAAAGLGACAHCAAGAFQPARGAGRSGGNRHPRGRRPASQRQF